MVQSVALKDELDSNYNSDLIAGKRRIPVALDPTQVGGGGGGGFPLPGAGQVIITKQVGALAATQTTVHTVTVGKTFYLMRITFNTTTAGSNSCQLRNNAGTAIQDFRHNPANSENISRDGGGIPIAVYTTAQIVPVFCTAATTVNIVGWEE